VLTGTLQETTYRFTSDSPTSEGDQQVSVSYDFSCITRFKGDLEILETNELQDKTLFRGGYFFLFVLLDSYIYLASFIHSLANISDHKVVSLHVYSPPYNECHRYHLGISLVAYIDW